jgi:hypothetical protein
MAEGSFEISIDKEDSNRDIDKNNVSIKAFKSYQTFVDSLGEIAKSQFKDSNLSFDLGTNKIALKSSVENIDKLQKSLDDYANNKIAHSNRMYKALNAIETVISANGLTYSAIVKGSKQQNIVTPIFERSKDAQPGVATKINETKEQVGLKFYSGRIKSIDIEKDPNFIKFALSSTEDA